MSPSFFAVFLLCQLVCHSAKVVYADYKVTVELQSYENPTHMTAQSNDCCDGGSSSNCNNDALCDNRFRFCYSDSIDISEYIGTIAVRPEEVVCECQFATDLVEENNDNITFQSGTLIGGNTRNPLVFHGDVWPGLGYLLLIVFDVDDRTLDDTVDVILVPIVPSSLRAYSEAKVYSGVFEYGKLKARYRVDCEDNFFGSDCSVLCVETDNADGHYVCDNDGNRVCLDGYTNASSDCTECVPPTGCSPVGGHCSQPGECICYPGFTGQNCTEEAMSEAASGSQTSVYALAAVTAVLALFGLLLTVLVVILFVRLRIEGKVGSEGERISRGYYMNEGLGPTTHTLDADTGTDAVSQQYATVASRQSPNDRGSENQVNHNGLSHDGSNPSTSPNNDVPNSSLRPNVAYGIEKNRNRSGGVRVPMRPPTRPPH